MKIKKQLLSVLLIVALLITASFTCAFASSDNSTNITGLKVKNLKATQPSSSKEVKLTWSKVEGADGYEIYRAVSSSSTWTRKGDSKVTSYVNKGLTLGKRYYYKVRAYVFDANGKKVYSKFSDVVSMKTAYVKPTFKLDTYGEDGTWLVQITNSKNSKDLKVYMGNMYMWDAYYNDISYPDTILWSTASGNNWNYASNYITIKPGQTKLLGLSFGSSYVFNNEDEYFCAGLEYRGKNYEVFGNGATGKNVNLV